MSISIIHFTSGHFKAVKECRDWEDRTEIEGHGEIVGIFLKKAENDWAKGTGKNHVGSDFAVDGSQVPTTKKPRIGDSVDRTKHTTADSQTNNCRIIAPRILQKG